MREELRFEGEITTVVVSNDGIRWYAAIGVDTKTAPPPKRQGEAVGIDMGVRTLATLSDGTVIENPKALASAGSAEPGQGDSPLSEHSRPQQAVSPQTENVRAAQEASRPGHSS